MLGSSGHITKSKWSYGSTDVWIRMSYEPVFLLLMKTLLNINVLYL